MKTYVNTFTCKGKNLKHNILVSTSRTKEILRNENLVNYKSTLNGIEIYIMGWVQKNVSTEWNDNNMKHSDTKRGYE